MNEYRHVVGETHTDASVYIRAVVYVRKYLFIRSSFENSILLDTETLLFSINIIILWFCVFPIYQHATYVGMHIDMTTSPVYTWLNADAHLLSFSLMY